MVPDLPDVTFPRNRRLEQRARRILVPHWSNLALGDVERGVTSKRRTLIDCMRNLPLEESVPIVDSALRVGDVTSAELRQIAAGMRGRGRRRAIEVAAMATTLAANAYESTLRAIASTVPGLNVLPQQPIRVSPSLVLHPDLLDADLGIVIEAESFEWHGDRRALTRDCERYNAFANLGYLVIRFSWEQVVLTPAYVVRVLEDAVTRARRHANVARRANAAAA
jgi:very-short-patch-repair endonuclease